MARQSTKKVKAASGRSKVDQELSQTAGIDPEREAELVKSLAEMSEKVQAEYINEALQASQQMSELWSPHIIPILKQLRKKGVDLDSMRRLLEQSIMEPKSTAKFDQLSQMMAEQRPKILAAMSEVTDLKSMERLMRALVSSGRQGSITIDSVLAVRGREEEQ
jgi:hypothetical protein